jgi:hypothetical protein
MYNIEPIYLHHSMQDMLSGACHSWLWILDEQQINLHLEVMLVRHLGD